ncbi:hypothetical protein ABT009_33660 [Streptomyces sp. NPDC002896]|uniref:hypothetical protein n=1 Tax=Streptomyces sp. NPDC002896 TaxID=3154438 RepID=UPI0033335F9D
MKRLPASQSASSSISPSQCLQPQIAPGLLMRTGNAEALEREAAKLEQLLGEPAQAPRRGSATVGGELRNTRGTADGLRAEAARRVGEEERLLELLRNREQQAAALDLPLPLLEGVWAADEDGVGVLGRWEDRARKVARTSWWLLGPWRRGRALGALVSAGADVPDGDRPSWPAWATERPVPPELLESLADAVAVEQEVRELVPRHTG